ncbi:hypothetical protein ABPG74_017295 [Tetrahymena malaccensis]
MESLGNQGSDSYTTDEQIIQFSYAQKNYLLLLEIDKDKLLITVMLEELCQFKWQKQFTIEQLQEQDKIFNMFGDVEQSCIPLKKWFQSYIQNIKFKGDNMFVTFYFELDQIFKVQFTIQLSQCEMDNNEVISKLSEKITNLEKKFFLEKDTLNKIQQDSKNDFEEINKILKDSQKEFKQLNQIQQDQKKEFEWMSRVNQDSNKQINQLKESHLQQLKLLEENFQNQLQKQQSNSDAQINSLLKQINLLKPREKFSNILFQDEIEMITTWVSIEKQQMNLELVYRATECGFAIQKLYEKCVNKTPLVLVVQTTNNKRFGFYTDQLIRDCGGSYTAQNPNNLFIFSLDLKQKYTSNDTNNTNAFYFTSGVVALGSGHDFCLHSNSIDNASSYTNFSTYGKNHGMSGRGLLTGGSQNFTTVEIEIFQIKKI